MPCVNVAVVKKNKNKLVVVSACSLKYSTCCAIAVNVLTKELKCACEKKKERNKQLQKELTV